MVFLYVIVILCIHIDVKADDKMPVEVNFSGDDAIGNRLAYQVKENIRRANTMELSDNNGPKYIIIINSIDIHKENPGISSAYSIIWLQCVIRSFIFSGVRKDHSQLRFSDSLVGFCGGQRVKEVAEIIIAKTDKIITEDLKNRIDPISNTYTEKQLFDIIKMNQEIIKKKDKMIENLLKNRQN